MRSGRTGRRGWGGSEEGIVWAEQGIVWAEVIRENGEAGPGGSEGQGERGGGGRAAVEGVSGGRGSNVGRRAAAEGVSGSCGGEGVLSGVAEARKSVWRIVIRECVGEVGCGERFLRTGYDVRELESLTKTEKRFIFCCCSSLRPVAEPVCGQIIMLFLPRLLRILGL